MMKPIEGRRIVGPVRQGDDRDHFIPCGRCGTLLDMRRFDLVVAHEAVCTGRMAASS